MENDTTITIQEVQTIIRSAHVTGGHQDDKVQALQGLYLQLAERTWTFVPEGYFRNQAFVALLTAFANTLNAFLVAYKAEVSKAS
jgi:hypothetical protein